MLRRRLAHTNLTTTSLLASTTTMAVKCTLLGALVLAAVRGGNAFAFSNRSPAAAGSLSTLAPSSALRASYSPVFDFTLANETTKQKSAESFERIDDAIMGGISQSALRDVPNQEYASWSGVCRLDGGGFCGMRTLPFTVPLNATGYDGVYICCKLASDDEADRRMWKLTGKLAVMPWHEEVSFII